MSHLRDTIVALGTPPGKSAVALVRISGPKAFRIMQSLTKIPLARIRSHKVQFSPLYSSQHKKIDEALVWAMRAPRTYTGEDTVEISTHGNTVVVQQLLESAIKAGARLAERGEFTKRAFLSGKLDLSQAEAVAQIVDARSTIAVTEALKHLEGALSKEIRTIRAALLATLARVEASIDYPDEISEPTQRSLIKNITARIKQIEKLLQSSRQGALFREGIKMVIAGAPNVGKSSLLNRLVGESKAIVTDVPGTTRDALEEAIVLRGVLLRMIDTAGLRHSEDVVEKIGIERTLAHVDSADVVLFVVDASAPMTTAEEQKVEELRKKNIPTLVVGNKADMVPLKKKPEGIDVCISAKMNKGMNTLEKKLLRVAGYQERSDSSSPMLTELRHKERLLAAQEALVRVAAALDRGEVQDLITIDLKAAVMALGEITGEDVSVEVIDHIFEKFCVGK